MSKSNTLRTLRNATFALAAVAAMCFMTESSASAQRCGYGGGYGVGGYGGGHGYSGYSVGYRGAGISVNVGRAYGGYGGYGRGVSLNSYRPSHYRSPAWHNTSHYDYHPGEYRRHGNHVDYRPGHYDFHRTGHWDH